MKLNFLPQMQMSYSEIYGCSEALGEHYCDPCLSDREYARVRAAGWIKKSYLATLLAAPTTAATWTDGVTAGDIIILPQTSGSFDPGTPREGKGYGNRKVSYGPREMTLNITDPDYVVNYPFYNAISNQTDLVPFYVTSSLVHIFDTEATIIASDPVADELEAEVVWEIQCKVVSTNLPSKHALDSIASVFVCTNF
jgi:hypothetical protein